MSDEQKRFAPVAPPSGARISVVIGVFVDPESLVTAAREARLAGAEIHDAYTPFAVHGLDEAMGLRPTRLPRLCFALGVAGLGGMLGFQAWTFTASWPLNVGGKSFLALPALVPVAFETGVLFAALGTVFAFFWSRGLRPGKAPVLPAPGVTDDRFVLALRCAAGDREGTRALLRRLGAVEIGESEADA